MSGWRPDEKQLFRIHGWLGVNLGLLLFVVCFSGAFAVFAWELDWLVEPDLRVDDPPERVDWEAMREGVREAYPYHVARFYDGPRHAGFAAVVYGESPAGVPVKFYVHPGTGEVQERANFWTVQRFFRSFHRRLFVPADRGGILLVTSFSLVLLLSVTSGLLFYRNWRKNLLRLRTDSLRVFLSDLHKTTGLWSLLVSFVFIVTGIWYAVEMFAPAPDPYPQRVAEERLAERGPIPERRDWNRLVATARDSIPGFRPEAILEHGAGLGVGIRGQAGDLLVRDRANRVFVDPSTGRPMHVQRAAGIGLYQRWSDTADPLHFGTFGGLPTQALWLLLGLVLSGLPLTGAYLWHRRYLRRSEGGDGPAWPVTSLGLTAAVLVLSAVTGAEELDLYTGEDVAEPGLADRARVGPWTAELLAPPAGPEAGGGETGAYRAILYLTPRSDPSRMVNYRELRARPAAAAGSAAPVEASGRDVTPDHVRIELGANAVAPGDSLRVEVERWDGTVHAASLAAYPAEGGPAAGAARGALTTGPPPIPLPVWAVVAAFAALLLGIAAVWAWRLARGPR